MLSDMQQMSVEVLVSKFSWLGYVFLNLLDHTCFKLYRQGQVGFRLTLLAESTSELIHAGGSDFCRWSHKLMLERWAIFRRCSPGRVAVVACQERHEVCISRQKKSIV